MTMIDTLLGTDQEKAYRQGFDDGLAGRESAGAGLDVQRLTDALNAVLRKHPSLAYARFVYGETGAEVAAEYARLTAAHLPAAEEPKPTFRRTGGRGWHVADAAHAVPARNPDGLDD